MPLGEVPAELRFRFSTASRLDNLTAFLVDNVPARLGTQARHALSSTMATSALFLAEFPDGCAAI